MNWLAGQMMLAFGWRRALVMLGAGALAGLSAPPFFILPALFLALPLWVWALDGTGPAGNRFHLSGGAFSIGFFFGLGYFLVGLHWIGAAFFVDGGWLLAAMPFAVLALTSVMALFWGIASMLAHLLWSHTGWRILALAATLSAAEFVRGHVLTGFPFDLLGYALTANEPMMQAAGLVGVYGLTFLAALLALTPALVWPGDDRGLSARLAPFFAALVAIAAQLGYGQYRLQQTPVEMRGDIRMRLVQPAIDQSVKWQSGSRDFVLDRLLDLSRTQTGPDDGGLADVTHLIWPEAALPFYLSDYPEASARIARLLPEGTTLLTGVPRRDALGGPDAPAFNSIVALDDNAEIVAAYDKTHLVPVGEFLPFKDLFARLGLRQFVPGLAGWTHGTAPRRMIAEGTPPFMPLICYEAVFSGDLGPHVADTEFMLNLTNDAWFEGSIGPAQHAHHARLRAVEHGLPMVRLANSGVSAVTDGLGRVTARLAPGEVAVLDARVPVPNAPPPFQKFTHWPLLGAIVLALGLALAARRKHRSS